MELRNEAFHLLRQLFQQHTARWQQALPDLTKPQYAVMRSVAEHPGIEQVALIEAAVSHQGYAGGDAQPNGSARPGAPGARSGR
ncbi:marR family transcriptional regulator [Klebsiella pneumoniae]|uniref:MarR family transcriptional regulator n=1 Tax=Klebsiella pneumoniae TaxID=573 RepID=A0A2X3FBA6_KLEPN|nr:marR family transcriptional regulator [Klebsiella pneumoniae]